jgi:predicted transcriptional regulator YheO
MPTVSESQNRFVSHSSEESERLVEEIHHLLRESVQPYRAPTSEELRERAASIVPRLTEAGLSDDEFAEVVRTILARVIEARFSERITETLDEAFPVRPKQSRGFGRLTGFALSNG